MSKWQELENECCKYLNDNYGAENIKFEVAGGSDSKAPDIKVYINDCNKYNIEVKSASAQSGQFVVLEENGAFIFSSRNKSSEEEALSFLKYMNENFEKYKNVSTTGASLEMNNQQYLSWIVGHYISKNETFIITKHGDSFVLFPTTKYGEYFETSATYRVKKSGSQDVPKSYAVNIKDFFFSVDDKSVIFYDGKKLLLTTSKTLLKKEKFLVGCNEYIVSEIIGKSYYIRKLSNTNNANVIFSVKLKKDQHIEDLELFREALK